MKKTVRNKYLDWQVVEQSVLVMKTPEIKARNKEKHHSFLLLIVFQFGSCLIELSGLFINKKCMVVAANHVYVEKKKKKKKTRTNRWLKGGASCSVVPTWGLDLVIVFGILMLPPRRRNRVK